MAIKSYVNPNVPKPKPTPAGNRSNKDGLVTKPIQPGTTLVEPPKSRPRPPRKPINPRRPGEPENPRPRPPRKPINPSSPGKREKRPLPKPATKPFDLRKEKQLPRRFTSVISKRKPAPNNKGGR